MRTTIKDVFLITYHTQEEEEEEEEEEGRPC